MFGSKKTRTSNGTHLTDDDLTPPPLDDLKMQDVSLSDDDDNSNGSMSDFEDEEDVENLQQTAAKQTRKTLAKGETKAVSCLRYVVIGVLLATAIGVSVATYLYARSVERESFEAEFEGVAAMTLRSFAEAVEHKLAALDVLSAGVTSHALDSGETFPNVTVPHFEIKGDQVRTQTDGIYSFYLPLVTDETRAGYEAYTKTQWGHLISSYMAEEGLRKFEDKYFDIDEKETQATDAAAEEATAEEEANLGRRNLHAAGPDVHPDIHDGIWDINGEDWIAPYGTGPYLPMWQLSPILPLPSLINFNFLAYTDLAPMMRQSIESGKAALSYIQTDHQGSDTEDLIRAFMTMNQYRHENIDYNEDPMTQVTYPVFDTFSPWKKKVTGLVITTIFWRLLFTNTLPESVQGVVCVLTNTLGESVTYQINGKDAVYLGVGDLHDNRYNDMGVSRDISEYLKERAGPQTQSYTTVELDAEYASYSIYVYPSQTMQDTYITSDPIIYAVVVAFIFVFTSVVFLLYDWIVERRQRKVMDKAVKSTAVVTSLFPEAVHEQLFAEAEADDEEKKKKEKDNNHQWKTTAEAGEQPTVRDLMNHSGHGDLAPPRKQKGRPIADKFPNTTVLFADLAGFTKWSSTREPEHVFMLLEALYGAFDKVALRRAVFKVETIGDCYMAVTGLPNPQPDHAVTMVKFARDCQNKMHRLVEDLALKLGEDTKELAMRVGCHSGPVTAGVLRGDKGRFQLFGDTVNTASRMESNGVKGRIHVSESCAVLLPEKWLTMREDKIVAKGKGEMTTYFVDVGQSGTRSSMRSAITLGSEADYGNNNGEMDDTIQDLDASAFGATGRRSSDCGGSIVGRRSSDCGGSVSQRRDSLYHDYNDNPMVSDEEEQQPCRDCVYDALANGGDVSFHDEPEQRPSLEDAPTYSSATFGHALAEKLRRSLASEVEC